eukprot:10732031-Alexandrium_andersonii.AAC.1
MFVDLTAHSHAPALLTQALNFLPQDLFGDIRFGGTLVELRLLERLDDACARRFTLAQALVPPFVAPEL